MFDIQQILLGGLVLYVSSYFSRIWDFVSSIVGSYIVKYAKKESGLETKNVMMSQSFHQFHFFRNLLLENIKKSSYSKYTNICLDLTENRTDWHDYSYFYPNNSVIHYTDKYENDTIRIVAHPEIFSHFGQYSYSNISSKNDESEQDMEMGLLDRLISAIQGNKNECDKNVIIIKIPIKWSIKRLMNYFKNVESRVTKEGLSITRKIKVFQHDSKLEILASIGSHQYRPLQMLYYDNKINEVYDRCSHFIKRIGKYSKSFDLSKVSLFPDSVNISFLFYGPPGTGKTTFAIHLAGFLKYDVVSIDLTRPEINNSNINQMLTSIGPSALILFEDFDEQIETIQKRENTQKDGKYLTLSCLLNVLSGGNKAISKSIVIYTANNVEKFPQKLIRSGRIDHKIHFPYQKMETKQRYIDDIFLKYKIIPKDLPDQEYTQIRNILCKTAKTICDLESFLITTKSLSEIKEKIKNNDIIVGGQTVAGLQQVVENSPQNHPIEQDMSLVVEDSV